MSKSTSDLFRKAVLVAIGATAVTLEKVNSIIDELVEKGEMNEQQAKAFKEEVRDKAVAEKEAFEKKVTESVKTTVEKVLKDIGVATVKDLEALEEKINSKINHECCSKHE